MKLHEYGQWIQIRKFGDHSGSYWTQSYHDVVSVYKWFADDEQTELQTDSRLNGFSHNCTGPSWVSLSYYRGSVHVFKKYSLKGMLFKYTKSFCDMNSLSIQNEVNRISERTPELENFSFISKMMQSGLKTDDLIVRMHLDLFHRTYVIQSFTQSFILQPDFLMRKVGFDISNCEINVFEGKLAIKDYKNNILELLTLDQVKEICDIQATENELK